MVFVIVLLVMQAVQQTPPRDAKPTAASGTAVIAGRVIDAETETPISGALLQIGSFKMGERSMQVEAGPRGEFRLEGVAAGDYVIVASPPEYRATHLPQVFNGDMTQIMMGSGPPSLQLSNGERREDIVIKLARAFAVDGMVVDELGEPMANVSVSAELVQLVPGTFPVGMERGQRTDDRGVFRVFGLGPATYRVCASPERDFQVTTGEGNVFERRYVKTCYPSAPAGSGERIAISPTATLPVLTIVMQRSTGYTIAGRATSESGSPNVQVNVQRIGDGGPRHISAEMRQGGNFTARGVTPGKYRISARAGEVSGPFDSTREQAETIVEVTGADVVGLELVARKGATLVGRIAPAEPLPSGTKLQITHSLGLEAIALGGSMSPRPAPVRADLTFEFIGVHGNVLFEVPGLPAGWVVTSIRYRGTDVTDSSTAVTTTTDPADLQIQVSPHSAQISARPVGADGSPAPGSLVLLFPAKGDRFSLMSAFGRPKAREDQYQDLGHVRPGEHRVVAVALSDLMFLSRDMSRFAALRELGQLVNVAAGERLRVDVVVRAVPEGR